MWWFLLCLLAYVTVAGAIYKSMLILKGYSNFVEIETDHNDQPLIIFGSMFWFATIFVYMGMCAASYFLGDKKS